MEDTTVMVGGNAENRAEIEAGRGIVRDAEGSIIRTKEWRVERKEVLVAKLADLHQRIANVEAEMVSNDEALASM